MQYKKYIKDVTPVSEIGLGAWQLGNNSGWQSMSENEAIALVEKSLEYGINFFDTAPNYGTPIARICNKHPRADSADLLRPFAVCLGCNPCPHRNPDRSDCDCFFTV